MSKDPFVRLINRAWKSQLAITGMGGMPEPAVAGNVVLPKVSIKLSLRLPPTMDGELARKNLEEIILKNPPYGAKVTMEATRSSKGWNCP